MDPSHKTGVLFRLPSVRKLRLPVNAWLDLRRKGGTAMTTVEPTTTTIQPPEPNYLGDEAQLAAAAFLARYSGRTLDAYHHDLRGYSSGRLTSASAC